MQVQRELKTMDEVEDLAELYHEAAIWDYHLEILNGNDSRHKLLLFREMNHG